MVLSSAALEALRASSSGARITLVVRDVVAPFVAASPVEALVDRVIPLSFDPYKCDVASPSLFDDLEQAFEAFKGEEFDTFVSAELRPTWLTFVLAARLRPKRSITLRRVRYPRELVGVLCDRLELSVPRFERYADANAGTHELERYRRLLNFLGASDPAMPRWSVPPAEAERVLQEHGLAASSYLVCFPTGAESTPYKRWPSERFLAVLKAASNARGGRVVIAGSDSERSSLEAFAALCSTAGLEPHVFAGDGATFGELRALLAGAWGYLGNDTGLAHLAAVHGVPGVTVFGGGTWPMYAPWAPGSIGVVHPLPCFGCFWDCAFGHGICVEAISADQVLKALHAAVAAPKAPARTIEIARLAPQTLEVIGDGARRYRESQTDRAARMEALIALERETVRETGRQRQLIEGLTAEAQALRDDVEMLRGVVVDHDVQVERLHQIAEDRLKRTAELDELVSERDVQLVAQRQAAEDSIAERDARIALLARAAEDRLGRIAALERVAEERLAGMLELKTVAEERLAVTESLRASIADGPLGKIVLEAARRKELIDRLYAEVDEMRKELEMFRTALPERDTRIGALEEIAAERLSAIVDVQHAAEERLVAIEELRSTLAYREAEAEERLAMIDKLRATLAAREAELSELEQLRRVAEERLQGMRELDKALNATRAEAEKRAALLAEMSEVLERQDREIGRLRGSVRRRG